MFTWKREYRKEINISNVYFFVFDVKKNFITSAFQLPWGYLTSICVKAQLQQHSPYIKQCTSIGINFSEYGQPN